MHYIIQRNKKGLYTKPAIKNYMAKVLVFSRTSFWYLVNKHKKQSYTAYFKQKEVGGGYSALQLLCGKASLKHVIKSKHYTF